MTLSTKAGRWSNQHASMLPRYQNRCVTCVWLGLGLGLGPRGHAVLCTLCNVSTSTAAPTPRSGESTPGRHQRAAALHKGVGAAGPKRKRPNGLERSVRRDATAKLHPASAICVLRSTSTSRQNPKPGQIDFGRLLVMGIAATILKSVRQRTREKRRRRQTIAHRRCRRMPALSAYLHCPPTYLPTKYSQPSHPAVYRTSTQAKYGRGTETQGPGSWTILSRVIFITEPEGRAWRATDRLLADRCRGAPRPPKAPVMLAKPQFEPRS